MKQYLVATVLIAAIASAARAAEPVDYVDPFIGTAGTGHTFPGACMPFGLVQTSPDTGKEKWDYCSGYMYGDRAVFGFSNTHLNGTGCCDLGDILVLPFTGDLKNGGEPIDKATEKAEAGYYAVTLADAGIRAEASAANRAAIYRFTPQNAMTLRLLVDGQWGLCNEGTSAKFVLEEEIELDEDGAGLYGRRKTRNWNLREMGFAMRFDHAAKAVAKLPKCEETEKGVRYVFDFGLKAGEPLLVKVALSASGKADAAKKNLAAEIPGWDFDDVRTSARKAWNDLLGVATIEGADDEKRNWYTSLYHLCIQPNVISDAGEEPLYSTFSSWDTFRAAGPLYTILMPDKAAAFVYSMLWQGRKTGYLPIWTLWGSDNQCMIGTHSIPMIVDLFLKSGGVAGGILVPKCGEAAGIDWNEAYAQIKETLASPHAGRRKENWDLYDRYGYYPFDFIKGESVSRTMECAYDDWCAAVMAKALGRDEDAAFFGKRANNWKNVFDPSIGFVRGRDSKGRWREPYDPFRLGHGSDVANDFTEGNAFQYTWHVMQDPEGLAAAMGGREEFVKKLDSLFTAPDKTDGMGCVVDITGLVGQYVHGNEPSHHVIYFYPQAGEPGKAAERIREVFDKFYLPKADGLCGNDDCGQMSAWYVFSAMGFYPFNPCGGEYVIGAPQIAKATLRLSGGKTFTVEARNLSRENKYVKRVTLNGREIEDWKIRHSEIMCGGTLVFEMWPGRR